MVFNVFRYFITGCTEAIDVHFALDGSANVGDENFEMMKNFVKGIGGKFILSETGSHMSASVFGKDTQMSFDMSKVIIFFLYRLFV